MSYPNIYTFGQCTWGAANLENWVLRYGNLGNALDWAANWREKGGFVQMTPAVNAVACFQPRDNEADAVFGHVAVVINVTDLRPLHFTVDEMNGPRGPGRYDDRVCINDPGVSFLMENAPAPTPEGDPDVPPMYQRINGSTYLLVGSSLLTLGNADDIRYNLSLGSKIIQEKELTAEYAASLNKLPVI